MNNDNLIIKPKLKGEDGHRVISIRVKEEIVAGLDKIAEQTGRSRNELIGTFLEYALERCVVDESED